MAFDLTLDTSCRERDEVCERCRDANEMEKYKSDPVKLVLTNHEASLKNLNRVKIGRYCFGL